MKKIKLLIVTILFISCSNNLDTAKQRKYTFEVHYIDRIIDTLEYISPHKGSNIFYLQEGNIKNTIQGITVTSYVKYFRVLKIDTLQ